MYLTEVKDMQYLKELIINDKELSKYDYLVEVFQVREKDRFQRGDTQKIRFGNEEASRMGKVYINIYKDKVSLNYASGNPRIHEQELNICKEYGIEQCILIAINKWQDYYKG